MKRPVPDWLPQLVWFLAGIYATGALWFYLGKDGTLASSLSLLGAIAMTLVAIQLQRVNDKGAYYRHLREALAHYVDEANTLLGSIADRADLNAAYKDWVDRVQLWLEQNLDNSYVTRFGNFSGMVFYSSGSEASQIRNAIDGRVRRLNEFIQEFRA